MVSFRVLAIIDRQKVLHGRVQVPEILRQWGDFYCGLGRIYDAIDFYEKAGAETVLREIGEEAAKQGNLFLFRRTRQAVGQEPGPAELEIIAGRADAKGLTAYARQARGEPAVEPTLPSTATAPRPPADA